MSKWQYTKGLHDLGRGCYAYLQPDGSWGWSNAGLIVGDGTSLLVYGTDAKPDVMALVLGGASGAALEGLRDLVEASTPANGSLAETETETETERPTGGDH